MAKADSSERDPLINPHTERIGINDDGNGSARYGRAACFIMKLGCQTLKSFVIDKMNIDKDNIAISFTKTINDNQPKFNALDKRTFTNLHKNILFPDRNAINIEAIDLSLWILIGRTLVTETTIADWKKKPLNYEIMPGHDFVRIRDARNLLAHKSTPELSYTDFDALWQDISSAMLRLGTSRDDIDYYKNRNLDPETTEKCILEVQKQGLEELKSIYLRDTQTKNCIQLSVIAMAVIAAISVVAIVTPIVMVTKPRKQCSDYKTTLDSDVVIYYIPREGWGAKPPNEPNKPVSSPVPYLIVSDTGFVGRCIETEGCCRAMREIQDFNMEKGFSDVVFTYIVGDDGTIFEGRGLDQIPATAKGYNEESVSIAFMGTYFTGTPSDNAMQAAYYFILHLRDINVVESNFTLYALCQLRSKFPCSPGPEIYKEMKGWRGPNWGWRPTNGGNCSDHC